MAEPAAGDAHDAASASSSQSGWVQLRAQGPDIEAIEDALLGLGAVSVTLHDADDTRDTAILEPAIGTHPTWPNTVVTGLFEHGCDEQILSMLLGNIAGFDVRVQAERLEDRDWVRAWMDSYRPMRFGSRLWVCPTGASPPADAASSVVVQLDPGLAFGTGTHPTTAMCLDWLDGADIAGKRVLDFGCGSGVLAVAAARLGARAVTAVDIDPQAVTATTANAASNAVDVVACLADALPSSAVFDIVLANILAGPLIELADDLLARLCPGGTLVLAGLLADQAEAVRAAYASTHPLTIGAQREDWVRLQG